MECLSSCAFHIAISCNHHASYLTLVYPVGLPLVQYNQLHTNYYSTAISRQCSKIHRTSPFIGDKNSFLPIFLILSHLWTVGRSEINANVNFVHHEGNRIIVSAFGVLAARVFSPSKELMWETCRVMQTGWVGVLCAVMLHFLHFNYKFSGMCAVSRTAYCLDGVHRPNGQSILSR
jgi:hypothetical protein